MVDVKNFRKSGSTPLKINKRLPQIVVPSEKIQMFIDWWNTDIQYESSVPHSFDEGYIRISGLADMSFPKEKQSILFKALAKEAGTTYRQIENLFSEFISTMNDLVIYFKFLADNKVYAETYDSENMKMSNMSFEVGQGDGSLDNIIDLNNMNLETFDDALNNLNYINLAILVSVMWYIASASRSTKYIYEQKTPVVTSRHKNTVVVSDTKTISTPIYDMTKIRTVKVEHLQARKKGWTYSHSFQVHGHYRHYKNGKTIFINSYVKGKDKEFKAQTITVSPDKIK